MSLKSHCSYEENTPGESNSKKYSNRVKRRNHRSRLSFHTIIISTILCLTVAHAITPVYQHHPIQSCFTEDYMGSDVYEYDQSYTDYADRKESTFQKRKKQKSSSAEVASNDDNDDEDEEHPLRTDVWLIEYHIPLLYRLWSKISERKKLFQIPKCLDRLNLLPPPPSLDFLDRLTNSNNETIISSINKKSYKQVVKFSPNGFVLLVEENFSTRKTKVGTWKINQGAITWEIPVRVDLKTNDENDNSIGNPLVQVQYNSDIHLNKFGKMPRMFRGVITRDRCVISLCFGCNFCFIVNVLLHIIYHLIVVSVVHCISIDPCLLSIIDCRLFNSKLPPELFRPVLATFTAVGVGYDTSDVSYKSRGIGLMSAP